MDQINARVINRIVKTYTPLSFPPLFVDHAGKGLVCSDLVEVSFVVP